MQELDVNRSNGASQKESDDKPTMPLPPDSDMHHMEQTGLARCSVTTSTCRHKKLTVIPGVPVLTPNQPDQPSTMKAGAEAAVGVHVLNCFDLQPFSRRAGVWHGGV